MSIGGHDLARLLVIGLVKDNYYLEYGVASHNRERRHCREDARISGTTPGMCAPAPASKRSCCVLYFSDFSGRSVTRRI